MTSAARPTWLPAQGGYSLKDTNSAPSRHFSAKDLAGETKLKTRAQIVSDADPEKAEELRQKLKQAEMDYFAKRNALKAAKADNEEFLDQPEPVQGTLLNHLENDKDDTDEEDNEEAEESDSSDDDSDDDNAQLLLELEKIKKERAIERERQERLDAEERLRNKEEEAMSANPLLSNQKVTVKRRWDDDVVFKHQAKGVSEKPAKRFINDLIRYFCNIVN